MSAFLHNILYNFKMIRKIMTTTVTASGLFLSVGALATGEIAQEQLVNDQANRLFLRELSLD